VLSESESQDVVEELATVADVVPIDRETVLSSVARSRQRGFSYWDALIVEAALGAGCVQLLSEDMQHGRRIDTLRIENPFRGPTAPSS
jgi:predicted nucleic acid-binding protein